jgi:hypothetical protein
MQKYEKLSAEYEERGFTFMISHYIKRIPDICGKMNHII